MYTRVEYNLSDCLTPQLRQLEEKQANLATVNLDQLQLHSLARQLKEARQRAADLVDTEIKQSQQIKKM